MLRDARDFQILFLSSFLLLGIVTRDWTLRPAMIAMAIASCLLTQLSLSLIRSRRSSPTETKQDKPASTSEFCTLPLFPNSGSFRTALSLPASGDWDSKTEDHGNLSGGQTRGLAQLANLKATITSFNFRSPLITSLSLSLLLRADHLSTMAIAGVCAIASKFLLKFNGKHFFNPANFGIIIALILTQDAWVSPGQWGEETWYALMFLGAGGIVLNRVGRWDTTAAFLGVYAVLEAVRNFYLDWTWDVGLHRLMSGSLLLFALFMVTDPRSIPNARGARLIWASAIAILTFILRNFFFLPTAVFWSLFALAPLTLLLDYFWPSSRFSWQSAPDLITPEQPPETAVVTVQ